MVADERVVLVLPERVVVYERVRQQPAQERRLHKRLLVLLAIAEISGDDQRLVRKHRHFNHPLPRCSCSLGALCLRHQLGSGKLGVHTTLVWRMQRRHFVQAKVPVRGIDETAMEASPVLYHVVYMHHALLAEHEHFDERGLGRERFDPRLALLRVGRAQLHCPPTGCDDVELVGLVSHLPHLADVGEFDDRLWRPPAYILLLVLEVHNLAACEHKPAQVPLVEESAAELLELALAQHRRFVVGNHLKSAQPCHYIVGLVTLIEI